MKIIKEGSKEANMGARQARDKGRDKRAGEEGNQMKSKGKLR